MRYRFGDSGPLKKGATAVITLDKQILLPAPKRR